MVEEVSTPECGANATTSHALDPFTMVVDRDTAARFAGCTVQWLGKLVKDGYITQPGRGQYLLFDVVAGRLKSLQDEKKTTTQSASVSRVQDARAAEIQLRMAEKLKTLQAKGREAAFEVIDHVVGPMRSEVQSLPARWTNDIALRRRCESDLNAFLDRAAKRAATFGRDRKPRRKPAPDAAAVKPRRVGKGEPNVPGKRGRTGPKKP